MKQFDIVRPSNSIPHNSYGYVTRPNEKYSDEEHILGMRIRIMSAYEGWESKWYRQNEWDYVVSTVKFDGRDLMIGDWIIGDSMSDIVGQICHIHYNNNKIWEYRINIVPGESYTEYIYPDQIVRFYSLPRNFEF